MLLVQVVRRLNCAGGYPQIALENSASDSINKGHCSHYVACPNIRNNIPASV